MTSLAGTGTLAGLIVRRDRLLFALWIAVAAMIPMGLASAFRKLYPTADALRAFAAECMSNPLIVAVLGPIYSPTVGALTAWRASAAGMFATGLVSLLFVIRHTRPDEENGRRELVATACVGRAAPLAAALLVTLSGNLILAAVIAGGLAHQGLPLGGSLALGLSWAAAGWIFAGVGALASELCTSASSARNLSFSVFGLFFIECVAGDSGGANGPLQWISWASPLGWTRLARPFASERWWIFAAVAGLTAVLASTASVVASRRDLGAGLIAPRPGPANAPPDLCSPAGLAWRLHRGPLIGWCVAFAMLGLLLGAVVPNLSATMNSAAAQAWLIKVGAHDPTAAFLRIVVYVLGETIAAFAILASLTMRTEEADMRAELSLASPVSRTRWALSHFIFAIGGPAAVMLTAGAAAGLAYGLTSGNLIDELPRMIGMMVGTLPAVWVMAAIALAAFGLLPRYAIFASWMICAAFLALELAWETRQVSSRVFAISPFAHVHWTDEVHTSSLILLVVVAALLATAGLAAFNRRDIG
jgi:ABC-2 type transport system permease protein